MLEQCKTDTNVRLDPNSRAWSSHGSFDRVHVLVQIVGVWLTDTDSEGSPVIPLCPPLSSRRDEIDPALRPVESILQRVWRIVSKRGRNCGSSPNSPPFSSKWRYDRDVDRTRKIICTWEEMILRGIYYSKLFIENASWKKKNTIFPVNKRCYFQINGSARNLLHPII